MRNKYQINRIEFLMLRTLYDGGYKDCCYSMTINEIMDENLDDDNECILGARLTVYKKLQKLLKASFIEKGILDARADTYFITEKGIKLIEERVGV